MIQTVGCGHRRILLEVRVKEMNSNMMNSKINKFMMPVKTRYRKLYHNQSVSRKLRGFKSKVE